jgi:hypothetical protein
MHCAPMISLGAQPTAEKTSRRRACAIPRAGQPLLFGASRKRMIGALSAERPAHDTVAGSEAPALAAMNAGTQVVRVHDVLDTVQARNVFRGLHEAARRTSAGWNSSAAALQIEAAFRLIARTGRQSDNGSVDRDGLLARVGRSSSDFLGQYRYLGTVAHV